MYVHVYTSNPVLRVMYMHYYYVHMHVNTLLCLCVFCVGTMLLYHVICVCPGDFSWDMWKDQDSDEQPSHYHSQTSLDSEGVRTL